MEDAVAMPQPIASVTSSPAMPATADVVVIGGGIIGVTAALSLAERGQKVVLIDKGRVAAEQSSRNWGWVRQQGRDRRELPLIVAALAEVAAAARDSRTPPASTPASAARASSVSPGSKPTSTAGAAGRCAAAPPASP